VNHIEQLQALGACGESIEFAAQFSHAQEAWENNTRPDWALWLLARLGGEHKRMAVRLAADFAEHVIHLAGEGRPVAEAAIASARAWVDNPCEETQSAALRASYAAFYAAYDAASYAATSASAYAVRVAAYAVHANYATDLEAEKAWQISRIREICPNCPIGGEEE
jgi:hypothetical protein